MNFSTPKIYMATIRKPVRLLTRLSTLGCLKLNRQFTTDRVGSTHEDLELYSTESHMHTKGLFETIKGHRLHFVRTGHGNHNLLLCPAPLGSAMTDYSMFLEKLDKSAFTAVAWDPPGQGASIPPLDRSWLNPKRFDEDAQLGLTLMRTLNLCPFSILAWSDAIVTALTMALSYANQDEVRKLMLWALEGSIPCITQTYSANRPNQQQWFDKYRNTHEWPMSCRSPLEASYGSDYFQKQWSDYLDRLKTDTTGQSLPMNHWKGQLKTQWNSDGQPRIMLMRSPGWNNTENWLTYLLGVCNQTRIINWFDQTDKEGAHQPCWGPHKIDSKKFKLLTEQFLLKGEIFVEDKSRA